MRKSFPQIDMYKTGQNIKRIMFEKGMTVKDVQTYLELATPQSVYHWFNGRSLPTVDNLYALSELFCMPMDMLLCGTEKKDFISLSIQRINGFIYIMRSIWNCEPVRANPTDLEPEKTGDESVV